MAYNLKCLYFNRILIASLVRNLLKDHILNFKNNGNSKFRIHNKFSRGRVVKEKAYTSRRIIPLIFYHNSEEHYYFIGRLKTVFLNFSGMLGVK